MTIQSGKRGETDESERWRLYIVRGEVEEEAHLLQVRRCVAALRSRGSLVLVNLSTGTVFLWHGAKSLKHTRQVASAAAAALKEHRPPELNVRVSFLFFSFSFYFLKNKIKDKTNKQSVSFAGPVRHHPSSSSFFFVFHLLLVCW